MAELRFVTRREFVHRTLFATGGALLLGSCTSGSGSSGSSQAGADATAGDRVGASLPGIEGATLVTDPAKLPKAFKESPLFAEQVAAGKLPPVADRLGQDPLVLQPVHSVGKYGGELRRTYVGVGDVNNGIRFCPGPDSLLWYDYLGKTVQPNIARAFELSSDAKTLTLELRRGMKWSDGHAFTADDILFWFEDINLNKELGGSGVPALIVKGQRTKIEKVDDHTVRFVSPVPHPNLPHLLVSADSGLGGLAVNGPDGGGCYAPKHYLSQFHPKYTAQSELTRKAKAAGFANWSLYFVNQIDWTLNKELPTLAPWVMTRPINDSPWTFQANPYSIWVDVEGNQLPYIPKITMQDAGNQQVVILKAVAGEIDFQDRGLSLASLPVLLKNQERSRYEIHRNPSKEMDATIRINLAYQKDPVIGDLLRTLEFRRALSLGIDRDKINETFLLGTGVPSAMMPADDSPYFPGPEWRTKWATHDVAQANQLLDQIGLTRKDGQGYRMRPDGKGRIRLDYMANKSIADFPAMGELVKTHWKQIGIDMSVELVQGGLQVEKIKANEVMLQGIQSAGGLEDPFVYIGPILPADTPSGAIGIPYAKWFNSNGRAGTKPPPSLQLLTETVQLYRDAVNADEQERIRVGKQVYMTHADQVWSLGICGFGLTFYGLYYAKKSLKNVPARVLNSNLVGIPLNTFPMTLYYE